MTFMKSNTQTFDGIKFRLDSRNGYYWSVSKKFHKSMHRYVWEFYHGRIQEGYEIHHIDGDASNNEITNLKCCKIHEHRREHQEHKVGVVSNGKCVVCGVDLKNKCGVFCSSSCKQRYAREHSYYKVKKVCICCGNEFMTSKYRIAETCSARCTNIIRQRRIVESKPTMKCVICGKMYTPQPNKKNHTCSLKCTAKLWEINNPEKVRKNREKQLKGKTIYSKVCAECGKFFTTTESVKKYCCKDCAESAWKKQVCKFHHKCPQCGKEFLSPKKNAVCCSRSCSNMYRKGLS